MKIAYANCESVCIYSFFFNALPWPCTQQHLLVIPLPNLSTDCTPFLSHTLAAAHCLSFFNIPLPPPPPKLPSTISEEEDEEEPSDLHLEGDRLADVLAFYQERIHGVISDWMNHYREHIGIQPRSLIGSNVTSRSPTRATSSQGRRVKTSRSFVYGQSIQQLAYTLFRVLCQSLETGNGRYSKNHQERGRQHHQQYYH